MGKIVLRYFRGMRHSLIDLSNKGGDSHDWQVVAVNPLWVMLDIRNTG